MRRYVKSDRGAEFNSTMDVGWATVLLEREFCRREKAAHLFLWGVTEDVAHCHVSEALSLECHWKYKGS